MPQSYLEHHGIKGQKWGVRRKKTSSGSSDYKRAYRQKAKGAKNLSDKQLKQLNNRMQMEQQYSKLNPSGVERGKSVVKNTLAAATMAVTFYNLAKSPAAKAAVNVGKAAINKIR